MSLIREVRQSQSIPIPKQYVPKRTQVIFNPYKRTYVPRQLQQRTFTPKLQMKFQPQQLNPSDWIGDPVSSPAPKQITRFWFQNCNGLLPANDNLKF